MVCRETEERSAMNTVCTTLQLTSLASVAARGCSNSDLEENDANVGIRVHSHEGCFAWGVKGKYHLS